MEAMFTEKGAGSESESKRPSYMLDRSLIDERARTALDKIPHSKAPVYDQADEEGFAERAEERLKEAAMWLQSEKSKKNSIKNIRHEGRNRAKEMETRRREAMKNREEDLRQQRFDEIFDEEDEGEAEPNKLTVDPTSSHPRPHRTVPPVPRLSKAYTKEIEIPETQNMSDSSIIPSPGVPIVSRKSLEKDEGDAGDDDEDALDVVSLRASKEEQEVQEILVDVQGSLEMPRLTTPAPISRPAPMSNAESSIGSPGVDIVPRGAVGGAADVSFDVNQSAFGAGSIRVGGGGGRKGAAGTVKVNGMGKESPTVVRRQQWLQRGKTYAQEQRERRREVARKEKEAREETERKKRERLLALDINRRKLRTAPAPEGAKRRYDSLRATFNEMEDTNRILPERAYSQQAFKVGIAGDDVDQAATEALLTIPKEDIIAGTRAQQRISMGQAPFSPNTAAGAGAGAGDAAADADAVAAKSILDVDGGEDFNMGALLEENEAAKEEEARRETEAEVSGSEPTSKPVVATRPAARPVVPSSSTKPRATRTTTTSSSGTARPRSSAIKSQGASKKAATSLKRSTPGSSAFASTGTVTRKLTKTTRGAATATTTSTTKKGAGAASILAAPSSSSSTAGTTTATTKPRSTIFKTRPVYGLKAVRKASKTGVDSVSAALKAKIKGKTAQADTLDLLDQSDLIVTQSAAVGNSLTGISSRTNANKASTMSLSRPQTTAAARREIAEKKAAGKRFGSGSGTAPAAAAAPKAAGAGIAKSVSPSSPSRMQRGSAFPTNTRAGGYKSPQERAQTYIKKKGGKQSAVGGSGGSAGEAEEFAKRTANTMAQEPGVQQVQQASQQLATLTAQIGRRVDADLEIQNSIDVTDPEQVKARLAVEMSNRMLYQRDSLRPPAVRTEDDDESDVYEDTGSNDSELEDSATFDKPPSPSATRRPGSSYGRRSGNPVSPSDAERFGFGGAAEGVVAVGATAGGTTATSTAPLSPQARAAVGVMAEDRDRDGDAEISGSSGGHDASFEVEESDDVILEDDDVPADAGSESDSEGEGGEVKDSPAVRDIGRGAGGALSRDTSTDEVSELVADPLAGDYAEYINSVGAHVGTGVAARMMDMPRSRATAAPADTDADAGAEGMKVTETEREDILGELEQLEADHHREMARIAAANRGSDYETPFDPLPAPRHQTATEMKGEDDRDIDLNMGLDMIADRQKLSRAFDHATAHAREGFEKTIRVGTERDGAIGGARATKDSTPEDVRKGALQDIKEQEDRAKRSFVPNFNIDNMDIPSIREKRRMEIEEAVRNERELNMREPFKGPSLRNRGDLARELSSTYDATTAGTGLEGVDKKNSKFKSWHEEVQATLATNERRARLEEERRREIEENEAYLLDDEEDEDDDDDETLAVNILARELAAQKEALREKLVEKHSAQLREEAERHAKLAAGEEEAKNKLFADALTAANAPSGFANVTTDPVTVVRGPEADKENTGANASVVTVGAAQQQSSSFWDTMQYVHSPLERRYNSSDPPQDGPLFEGVDMENVILQSLMIAHKPDEWLRKDKEKKEGFNAEREIRNAIDKAQGKETTMGNVLSAQPPNADDVLGTAVGAGAGADVSAPSTAAAPGRFTPAQLREKMSAELKRQEEIHAYALELAEMEQAQAVQTASQVVEKVMQQASTDVGDIQRQQEMALQQQAYELSLTTAVNSVQAALAEETAKHRTKVQELELQLQRQTLAERELRMHASSSPQAGHHAHRRSGARYTGAGGRRSSADRDAVSMNSSGDANDDYSVVFEAENDSQISSAVYTSHGSPSKSLNRSIPSILDDIHASGDYGGDDSTVYTIEEASQVRSSGGRRYRDDSTTGDMAGEVEEEESIVLRARGSASSGRSGGTYSESEYSDIFDELDPRDRESAEVDQDDDSLSVTGSGSGEVPAKKSFSSRPTISASPTRGSASGPSPSRAGRDGRDKTKTDTATGESAASARSSASGSNVKFHQDTRSPKRQRPRQRHVASSLDSAVTMLSSADEGDNYRQRGHVSGAGGSSGGEGRDVTSKMLGEYRSEMEGRLRSQDKALKMRIHFLKTRRSHRLAVLEEKRQRIMKNAETGGKSGAVSGDVRKTLRTLERDEAAAKAEYDESRAELERERWTLNARAYRELRKFNSLKRDVEATALGDFIRGGEVPSPSTPDRPARRDGIQVGSANRDRPGASWARSRPSSSSSEGYSSLESSPSTGSDNRGKERGAIAPLRSAGGGHSKAAIPAPASAPGPDSSDKSSSGDSSVSSERDPNALSMSMLSTGRSVLSNVTNSTEKPPLASNNRNEKASSSSASGASAASVTGAGAIAGSPGIALRSSPPPSIAKDGGAEEDSVSLTESAIAETLAGKEKEKSKAKEGKGISSGHPQPVSPSLATGLQSDQGTPQTATRAVNNSTDTLEELERSIEHRARRVSDLQSNLENMQSREARLQALKERQEERSRLIAMEKELSLRISSEELYRDLSATQIKRLAAIGALPKEFLVPPDDDAHGEDSSGRGHGLSVGGSSGAALASLRASADKSAVTDGSDGAVLQATDAGEEETETERRLASLSVEDRARVQLLQKALNAPEPLEDEVVEEEMELNEDSWDSDASGRVAAATGGGRGKDKVPVGIAEGGDATSNDATHALTARINREAAAVSMQAAYRRYSAKKTLKLLQTWSKEARDDLLGSSAGAGAGVEASLGGDIAKEHKRLVLAQDEALDDSWVSASDSSSHNNNNNNSDSGLFDPEDDDTTGLLSTAVDRLHKAIKARDSAEKQQKEKERQEEEQRVVQSIARFSEAAAAAQRSADEAEQSVKTLDARIESALHGRTTSASTSAAGSPSVSAGGGIPIPAPIVTAPKQQQEQQQQQLQEEEEDGEASSIEFSIGDPESLPGSTSTSPRSISASASASASAAATKLAAAAAVDSSVSTLGDERSDFLSAAGSFSTSPEKSKGKGKGPPSPTAELPSALEQSYSSVVSVTSAAAAAAASGGESVDSASASFDASASIGAMEAQQRRRDTRDKQQEQEKESNSSDFEADEGDKAVMVPPPVAAVPPGMAQAAAAVSSSRDGSLAGSIGDAEEEVQDEEVAEDSDFEVGSKATSSGDDDAGIKDDYGDKDAPADADADAGEESSDFEVGSKTDEVDDEEESVGFRSVSSAEAEVEAETTMVPPTPTTPERNIEEESAEEGLTAIDASPTKVSVPGSPASASASRGGDASTASSSSPNRTSGAADSGAGAVAGAASTLGVSQSETVAWGDSKALPNLHFSAVEPTTTTTSPAHHSNDNQVQKQEQEHEERQSLESTFSVKTATASRASISEGDMADLTAISGIHPGSSVESGSLISTASDIAALRAADTLTGSANVSQESRDADADADADEWGKEGEEKEKEEEEEDEEVVEELEESIEELEDSHMEEGDSEPPSRVMDLHELGDLQDSPKGVDKDKSRDEGEEPLGGSVDDSNSGLDISALATSPAKEEEEVEEKVHVEEQSLTSLSGLPSLPSPSAPVPAGVSAVEEEDLYEFDASPAAPLASLAHPGTLSAADAGASASAGAVSPTSDGSSSGSDQGPALSTSLLKPIDWSEAVGTAADSLLAEADWATITDALRDPDYIRTSTGIFFTPAAIEGVLATLDAGADTGAGASYREATRSNASLIADRFNEILSDLHSVRHHREGEEGAAGGPRGSPRFEFGPRLLAQTHPLSEQALSETLLANLRKQQLGVTEVLSGRRHFLEMVEVDAVDQFKRDYSMGLMAAADEITDIILARALVDTAQVLDDDISEQEEALLSMKEK